MIFFCKSTSAYYCPAHVPAKHQVIQVMQLLLLRIFNVHSEGAASPFLIITQNPEVKKANSDKCKQMFKAKKIKIKTSA